MQNPAEITFHPLDLSDHGKSSAGLPLYRIVWADSRVDKVLSEGTIYQIPRYEAAEGKWVLEKYLTAQRLTGMTPLEYQELLDSQLFGTAQMEYPTDGDYELSYVFQGSVDPATARLIPSIIEFDQKNFTDAERSQAVKDSAEKKHFDAEALKSEIIKSALTRENK